MNSQSHTNGATQMLHIGLGLTIPLKHAIKVRVLGVTRGQLQKQEITVSTARAGYCCKTSV